MVESDENRYLFCGEGNKIGVLHGFCTIEADRNLRRIVTDLQDFELLAKISAEDLIASQFSMLLVPDCDTKYVFIGKGKRSAWQAWERCSHTVTRTIVRVLIHPSIPAA